MIPLLEPSLAGNEARYLLECVRSGLLSWVGPFVERLEHEVARASGAAAAAATQSGTAALHAALRVLGVEAGDLVAVPTYTFVASANAIALCGAEPWFFDVEPGSFWLDPERLARGLERETEQQGGVCRHRATGRRVSALMAVCAFGAPPDLDRIAPIAREHGLALLLDAAPALGARLGGRALGGLADLVVFSFNGNKTVTSGSGGAVVGPDEERVARVRHLTKAARAGAGYSHDARAFHTRMSNLQAAVGCAQLERLGALIARKREIRARYRTGFAGLPRAALVGDPPFATGSAWVSALCLEPGAPIGVEELSRQLGADGIDARSFWQPVHAQPPYREAPREGSLEHAERVAARVLALPSSVSLEDEEQAQVIDAVRKRLA
jgi:dTDP-4-amino-4,6-dideoxygalactose transaminase